mmetsp:Transcript_25001/g.40311  ORF Transcript_25001/g.40311 Transcript_25001/m.40311 type:complete len:121 (-) Transcript_25001:432-794(-)
MNNPWIGILIAMISSFGLFTSPVARRNHRLIVMANTSLFTRMPFVVPATAPRQTRSVMMSWAKKGGKAETKKGGWKGNKSNLPQKDCVVCGRPFTWRKKWERCWDEVKYCSDRCRREGKR